MLTHARPFSLPTVTSDPLDGTSQSGKIVLDIRKRKGLKPEVQPLNEYEDKLVRYPALEVSLLASCLLTRYPLCFSSEVVLDDGHIAATLVSQMLITCGAESVPHRLPCAVD